MIRYVGWRLTVVKIQDLREIIRLIDQSTINEFTYETNETKIKMKKTNNEDHVIHTIVEKENNDIKQQVKEELKQTKELTNKVETDEVSDAPDSQVNYDVEIVSPMVGTLYRAASPESDPYVQVGSKVEQDTVVCIVEAMKLFNEIEAEVSGEIVEILVEDGQLVEYGQPLFRVKKV